MDGRWRADFESFGLSVSRLLFELRIFRSEFEFAAWLSSEWCEEDVEDIMV